MMSKPRVEVSIYFNNLGLFSPVKREGRVSEEIVYPDFIIIYRIRIQKLVQWATSKVNKLVD